MMRVLLLLSRFSPTGQTNHAVDLARALCRAGHDVTLVSRGSGIQDQAHHGAYVRVLERAGVRMAVVDPGSGPLELPGDVPVPDVVHAHSTVDYARADRLSSRLGAPFILTVHGLGVTGVAAARFVPHAGAVIAVGRRVADEVRPLNRNVVLIENGVDTDLFHPPGTPPERPETPARTRPWHVLYAGRIDTCKRKGFRELVRAVSRLARRLPVRLTVLATNLPSLPPDLEEEAAGFIDFRGWLPDPSEAFREADVVVGCGRVIREGLASGRPCLLLGEAYCGMVYPSALDPVAGHDFSARSPDSPASEASRIQADLERLFGQPDLAHRLGREGRAYAVAHLSLDRMAGLTVTIYEQARQHRHADTQRPGAERPDAR